MNRLLSYSFIPFFFCCFVRASLAQMSGDGILDIDSFSRSEIVIYSVSIVLMGVFVWHIFWRITCPRCESYLVIRQRRKHACVDCGNSWE